MNKIQGNPYKIESAKQNEILELKRENNDLLKKILKKLDTISTKIEKNN